MQSKIIELVSRAVQTEDNVEVEIPKNEQWGDYSTNIAIKISKKGNLPVYETAKSIASKISSIDKSGLFSSIDPTPQGFINFKVSDSTLFNNIKSSLKDSSRYGRVNIGRSKKVLMEYVSANPTGPLHIGHGRWAVIGDSIANILLASGYKVTREYYVNDSGEQINKLVDSVIARTEGKDVPADGYAGSYVQELANEVSPISSNRQQLQGKVILSMLKQQKETLSALGVVFDRWFHESELHRKNLIKGSILKLEKKGLTFHEGSALWFKSSELGDDKNRVLIKDDGNPTYFAADIAYHANKYERGFDRLINVWGTDHHGYVARLKAAITALGYPVDRLTIIIGQLVALYRGKELIRMSKRTGEMITLKEVIDEIGPDATRYFLVRNSANTHIDFDLELAKSRSLENPVYYVCYAHARVCSIIKEASSKGLKPSIKADMSQLKASEERRLMIKLLRLEDEISVAANNLQPHRLTAYAEELAAIFHNYYHKYRVISDDRELSTARLSLAKSTSTALSNVLKLLGITAPEHM